MSGASIKPAKDGPYEVTLGSDFQLADPTGKAFDLSKQAAQGKIWLCRCGGSNNKPFCDGAHRKIGFKSEVKA